MKHAIGIFGTGLLLAAACSTSRDERLPAQVESVLRGAQKLELYALDPEPIPQKDVDEKNSNQLHGYAITSRATLTDAKARQELVDLVVRGIRESDGRVAACFNPRHGIRAELDSKHVELVICYECLSMSIHGNVLGSGVERASELTASSVEPAVTRIFTTAGLRIAAR
jgi:hypothetical protein